MIDQTIHILLLSLASVIIMFLHELPKAIIYTSKYNQIKKPRQAYKKNVFAPYQYIDPIGLIFCVTLLAGFSKPYVYRLNDKKMNRTLGLIGFANLFSIFLISIFLLNFTGIKIQNTSPEGINLVDNLLFSFITYMAILSMGMLLVNLFPIATFDMGLLIASFSSDKYYSIIKNDYFLKIILIFCLLFKIFPTLTFVIMDFFLLI